MRAQKAFKDGNKLYAASDWRAAADKYEEAIAARSRTNAATATSSSPTRSTTCIARRARASPSNDALLTKAIENYKLAAQNDPGPAVEAAVARVPGRRLRPRQAERPDAGRADRQADDRARSERPDQLLRSWPSIYEDSGEYELAEQTFLKAKDAKPNDPNVYMQLAGYYNRQGDFEKTIEALNERVKIEPNNPEAYYTVVDLLLGQGLPRLPAEGHREARHA